MSATAPIASGPRAGRLACAAALLLALAQAHAAVPAGGAPRAAQAALPATSRLAAAPEVIAVWREFLGLRAAVGRLYRGRGMQAYENGDLRPAAAMLSLAADFDPRDAESLGRLGFARKELGEYEGAVDALRRAIQEDPAEFQYHWWLGDTLRLLGDYEGGAQSMLTARDLAPPERFDELNDYVEFTRGLASSEKSWVNFDRHVQMAMRHDGLRRSRRCAAEYLRAAEVAPEESDENNDRPLRVGLSRVNTGTQYTFMKEPDVAVEYFQRALEYFDTEKHRVWVMRTHQNMAVAYRVWAGQDQPRRKAHLAAAAGQWERALEHARAIEDIEYIRYAQGALLRDLADAHGVGDERVDKLREANLLELPFRGPINDYSVAAVALGELACRVSEGDFAGQRLIIEMITEYYDEPRFLLDTEEAARLKALLAAVYHHQGHHKLAMETAREAAVRFTGIRDFIDADAYTRSDNEMNVRHAAATFMRAAIASGSLDQALENFDRLRQTQTENLLGNKVRDEAHYTDFATELELVRGRIPRLEGALREAEGARDAARSAFLRERLEKDRARAAWLERGAVFARPNTLAYRPAPLLDPAAVRAALPEDTTLVAYTFDRHGGVAVVLSRDAAEGVLLDGLGEATARELVAACREAFAKDPGAADEALEQLHRLLIAPIGHLLKTPVLQISPDEALHHLPFEALRRDGRALIEDFTVAYTPGGSRLVHLMDRNRMEKDRLRVAVRGDAAQADALAAAYETAEVLAGDDATESAVLNPRGADVLHISAPADFTPFDPMLGAVILAPDAGNDGHLHAAEWFAARTPVHVAVLDLAHTLDPSGVRGTDLAAFTEAAFHAGAAAVVANLWTPPAQERAAVLAEFHKNLRTMGLAEALRAAKLAHRERAPGYAWAAFTLTGDHR